MGMVKGLLTVESLAHPRLDHVTMQLIRTQAPTDAKVVRKSSVDLGRAQLLHNSLQDWLGADPQPVFVFAEIPSGAQDAKAARALGIAVGVLASIRHQPLIEVSPMEVKVAVSGNPKISPTKAQIIDWAVKRWPNAEGWVKHGGKLTQANEHLADALAIIVAGTKTPAFRNAMGMLDATSSSSLFRPSSRRIRLN